MVAALSTRAEVLFLLGGDISTIPETISRVKQSGRLGLLHVDLLEGLGKDEAAIRYLAYGLKADGIVSTRSNLVNRARREGMFAVLRLFMLDSGSIETGSRIVSQTHCDAVEIMPGLVLPELADRLPFAARTPIIAGGLITEATQVQRLLDAGAMGVSTGQRALWDWG